MSNKKKPPIKKFYLRRDPKQQYDAIMLDGKIYERLNPHFGRAHEDAALEKVARLNKGEI